MKNLKTLRLILGDQLNYQHSWFNSTSENVTYIIAEIRAETDYCTHHIQKVAAFFLAMQKFAEWLKENQRKVIYLDLDQTINAQDFSSLLKQQIECLGIEHFEYQLPDEYRLDLELSKLCSEINCSSLAYDSEHFITSREFLKTFFDGKKSYLMESFYRELRKRESILMNGSKPVGEVWNFDASNRKPMPKNITVPKALDHQNSCDELLKRISRHSIKTIGKIHNSNITWPVTREQAIESLEYFCKNLLALFGTYQDAMLQENSNLFHSRLSFALNVKILSPREVIVRAIEEWQSRSSEIDLSQIEGFVRQILGWREYMRGVYWANMPGYAELNFFNAHRKLPEYFWNAETKMNCLKQCITNSLDNAYAHHIQRLMITGNFAMLAGIDPKQVDQWYLGIYIDAIEWVEITNTRGMSQYADGGIVGSKPYASTANYINKMSNYCKGCSYNNKSRYAENACPFNSLYWNFFEENRSLLSKNVRLAMVYKNLNAMQAEEKQAILMQAQEYLRNIEKL